MGQLGKNEYEPMPEPSFTLTEVIEYGLVEEKDTIAAAEIARRLMAYAEARDAAQESDLPESVNTHDLLTYSRKEQGRLFTDELVRTIKKVGNLAVHEETNGEEQQ